MGDSESESTLHNNSLWWLACGMLALLANSWIILSITAKQQKHKPLELLLCFLAGTHILMAAVPLTTYAVVHIPQAQTCLKKMFLWKGEGTTATFLKLSLRITQIQMWQRFGWWMEDGVSLKSERNGHLV